MLDAVESARHRHCIGIMLDRHTRHLLATSMTPGVWSKYAHQQLAEMQSLTHAKNIKYSMTHTVSGNECT